MGTRLLRVFLIVLGVLLLAVGYLFWSMPKAEAPRVEATTRIVGVTSPNMYAWIIRTPNGAALVDTGVDPAGKAILAELKAEGVSPEQVHTVFITHGHADHIASAILFNKAKVYVGKADIPLMRGEQKPAKLPGLFSSLMGTPPAPTELLPLSGGETIDADGVPVKVISTPGHTDGSMMFLVGEVLFTGDSLMGAGKRVELAPSLFSKDPDQNRKSLQQLVGLPFTTIADGHIGATANAREKLRAFLGKK